MRASYSDITSSLKRLYLEDPRPWLVGFSGGKDSTLVAALVFDAVLSIPAEKRTKQLTIEARREPLTQLLKLQEEVGLTLISDDELFLIQQLWKSARRPDHGGGVAQMRRMRADPQIAADWFGHAGDLRARVRVQADDGHSGDNRRPGDGMRLAIVVGASLSDTFHGGVDFQPAGRCGKHFSCAGCGQNI